MQFHGVNGTANSQERGKQGLHGALLDGGHKRVWREGCFGKGLKVLGDFLRVADAVGFEASDKFSGVAAGNLWRAKAVLQEPVAGGAIRFDAALLIIQEPWEKAVHVGVEPVFCRSGCLHKEFAFADQEPEFGVKVGRVSQNACPAFKQAMSNAIKVKEIGGSIEFLPLLFGIISIDAGDQKTAFHQSGDEVVSISGSILAAKEDVGVFDLAVVAGGFEFGKEFIDSFLGVGNMEGFFKNVTHAIAKENGVRGFGKVQGRTENFARTASAFKKLED